MKKSDLLIGLLIGFISALIGSYIFIVNFTGYEFLAGIKAMKFQGNLGKVITLGAVLNLVIFFILLKLNREMMARGVVLATIILTVVTLFV